MKLRYWFVYWIGFAVSPAATAIVNVKSLHLSDPDPGLSGSISFGINGAYGNSQRIRTKSSLLAQWYRPGSLSYFTANYAYGKSYNVDHDGQRIDVVDVNNWYTHIRHIHEWNKVADWEIFGQIESNVFTRLTYRGLLGVGTRWSLFPRTSDQAAYIGTGLFSSQEHINDKINTTDSGDFHFVRANLYFIFKRAMTPTMVLQSTTYAQPVINDLEDWRLLEDAKLTVHTGNHLAVSLSLLGNAVSRPPQRVKSVDVTYTVDLEYEF